MEPQKPTQRREHRRAEDRAAQEFAQVALDTLQGVRDAVEGLQSAVSGLATKDEVKDSEKRQDRRRRFAIAGVVLLVVLLLVPVATSLTTLEEVQRIARENEENGDLLVDCTTPGVEGEPHPCYDRSLQAQANAVGQVALATLDAAICARIMPTAETIQACYEGRVAARIANPPEGPTE